MPAARLKMETKTRVVHCKKAPYDVYIGRGSIWGNKFTHKKLSSTKAEVQVATVEEAIRRYEEWLLQQPHLLARLHELRGKTLGCWCKHRPSDPCHGDVLARLADQSSSNPIT